MDEYREMLFVCACIFSLFGLGVLIFHGIGLIVMRLRDLRTGKRRLCVLTRVL